ncbi:hypothetical protein Taro_041248 [Colocasia esculenta]|uniref:Uncharacterized protein n=1 Tax=Colocasia esculenta TaxID=4460 RepID=A0A843WWS1_COLES|nr:hypothetical protein [Colocasia esculenta]
MRLARTISAQLVDTCRTVPQDDQKGIMGFLGTIGSVTLWESKASEDLWRTWQGMQRMRHNIKQDATRSLWTDKKKVTQFLSR